MASDDKNHLLPNGLRPSRKTVLKQMVLEEIDALLKLEVIPEDFKKTLSTFVPALCEEGK